MDFDRGLWSAAMNGEVGRVEKLLSTGSSPKAVDSAGYTPLVRAGSPPGFCSGGGGGGGGSLDVIMTSLRQFCNHKLSRGTQ